MLYYDYTLFTHFWTKKMNVIAILKNELIQSGNDDTIFTSLVGVFSSIEEVYQYEKTLENTDEIFYEIVEMPMNHLFQEKKNLNLEKLVKEGFLEVYVNEDGTFYFEPTFTANQS